MLKRFYVYFLLAVVFAITQTGIVTHEIAHIKELSQHSQSDKHQSKDQCRLCVAYSHLVGVTAQALQWCLPELIHLAVIIALAIVIQRPTLTVYAARAPPAIV
jgi:hypothetical protein